MNDTLLWSILALLMAIITLIGVSRFKQSHPQALEQKRPTQPPTATDDGENNDGIGKKNPIRIWSVIALLIPILTLTGLILFKQSLLQGQEVILPIRGFDPRNFISGHYLTYAIQYGITVCPKKPDNGTAAENAFICLEPRQFLTNQPTKEHCPLFIKGHCEQELFIAGIEKFYVPEKHAQYLGRILRDNPRSDTHPDRSEIVLAVSAGGRAEVKDLRINGESWLKTMDQTKTIDQAETTQ